jgi:hypothetical protein
MLMDRKQCKEKAYDEFHGEIQNKIKQKEDEHNLLEIELLKMQINNELQHSIGNDYDEDIYNNRRNEIYSNQDRLEKEIRTEEYLLCSLEDLEKRIKS